MCGICGILNKRADRPVAPDLLQRMNEVLRHRGPDDAGDWSVPRANALPGNIHPRLGAPPHVSLAMCRLAIIDLVTGHQPMANEDGTLHLVLNGEIYNHCALRQELQARGHHFATASDVEPVLHAYEEYGVDCVEHLEGMFGFALWDERHERLLLARDPFGIKPLYYTDTGDRLLWASEIKALLQDPGVRRRVDPEALDHYLTFLYVPSPRTMFEGIHRLPPGHRLIWERGTLTVEEYWRGPSAYIDPSDGARLSSAEPGGYEKALLQVLGDAIEAQLASEVPLGAFLSGGIDSTAVVLLMAERIGKPVQTFSIGFSNAGMYDELSWARIVAECCRTDHREFVVGPETVELLPRIAWHLDEPLADASAIPNYLVSQLARKHVTVALTGVGGDELFGGYRRYYADAIARRWQSGILRPLARRALIEPAVRLLPPGGHTRLHNGVRLARKFFDHLDRDPESRYLAWNASFTPGMKEALYVPGFRREEWTPSFSLTRPYFERVSHLPFAEQAMYVDMKTYLPEDPLMMADKMTMANSLEARVPFLDRRVTEFAAALPLSQKMHGRRTKVLLRNALRGRVPDDILFRPKQGFGTPIDLWLRRELRAQVARVLAPEVVAARGYFRPESVTALLQRHQQGRDDVSQHIWALFLLELWHRIFIDQDLSRRPNLGFQDLGL
ncbi:MAG TPA: asparagine synthase (glutamine-hydrolyzing) [Armatimonadota bacterium]|jgi:asparagine synthase (glutamine-hydrolysing)|nr:asparagine synthase (glutamine-hydrolyzing) [Armatimonadota bacterium]HOM83924.1 asparagine synthase (glutamine-hydrolyzing) [Armatimonadota bacterium]